MASVVLRMKLQCCDKAGMNLANTVPTDPNWDKNQW